MINDAILLRISKFLDGDQGAIDIPTIKKLMQEIKELRDNGTDLARDVDDRDDTISNLEREIDSLRSSIKKFCPDIDDKDITMCGYYGEYGKLECKPYTLECPRMFAGFLKKDLP